MKTFVILLNLILGVAAIVGSTYMNDSGDSTLFIFVGAIMIAGAIFAYFYSNYKEKEEKRLEEIELEYKEALKGTDKSKALRLGRIYYGSLREDGNVTIYDEQAITNDLSSMTNTVNQLDSTSIDNCEHIIEPSQKKFYCSKCGKAYIPNLNKIFCDECGNKY